MAELESQSEETNIGKAFNTFREAAETAGRRSATSPPRLPQHPKRVPIATSTTITT